MPTGVHKIGRSRSVTGGRWNEDRGVCLRGSLTVTVAESLFQVMSANIFKTKDVAGTWQVHENHPTFIVTALGAEPTASGPDR